MSEILKYKGPLGNYHIELELPLDLVTIDEEHRELVSTFVKRLAQEITKA